MQKNKQRKTEQTELADLTVSLVLSITYLVTVCWIVPIAPMVIIWMADWTFSAFLGLWLAGLPFACLSICYFLRKK